MPEDWKGLTAGVALAEALLAAAEGREGDAEAAFQRSSDINQQHDLVYDRARTLCQWAVMHLDRASRGLSAASGRADTRESRQRGLELLDQSLTLFQRCDAIKDIERVVAMQQQAQSQPEAIPAYPDGLTPREVEVLRLITDGKTDRGIAEELFLSTRTVTTHVRNILNKTNAANRAEAAAYALRNGLA